MKSEIKKYTIESIAMPPTSLAYNIEGAPFKIGDMVMVLNNPNNDSTFDINYSSKIGEVVYYEFDCGCGQTFPDNPMIGVNFKNKKNEEFWKEELCLLINPIASKFY